MATTTNVLPDSAAAAVAEAARIAAQAASRTTERMGRTLLYAVAASGLARRTLA